MGISRIAVQVAMELQDHAGGDRDVIMTLVDEVENVTVASDLALVTVYWLGLFEHEFAQALVGGRDVLDPVRCARALDFGHFHQGGEVVGVSAGEQGCFPLVLADVPKRGDDLGDHEAAERSVVVELGQSILAISVVYSPSIFDLAKIFECWRGCLSAGEDLANPA